ncbi:MAG TPA: extracellular solute-binding protein [Actinopolymorphaceae bacterium]
MTITRRQALAGLLGVAALGGTAACARGQYLTPDGTLSLWYWDRSISDTLLEQVPKVVGTKLQPTKVPGNFKSKLLTSLAGKAYIPDMTALNDNIATYFPDADQFVDLYDLGAKDLQDEYLDWKWQCGVTPEGRMIGFPMDTGPTALFYRADLFEKAGLPSEPREVEAEIQTWDDYLKAADQVAKALPGVKMVPDIWTAVYLQVVCQLDKRYMTKANEYIGDGDHIKQAWDLAAEFSKRGFDAHAGAFSSDWGAAMSSGKIASFVDAVWAAKILSDSTADSEAVGTFRVCRAPGGAGNRGGSFLSILKASRDPEAAWEVIKWVQSPKNQLAAYKEIQLFPAAKDALTSKDVREPEEYFGGQVINDVFGESARNVKPVYMSPYDDIITTALNTQLTNVWSQGKDPERAWKDGQSEVQRQLEHLGVV